ncbi:MAG: amidohydrolase family protein [Paracoccus sp. (in: a-proteobacteria)]
MRIDAHQHFWQPGRGDYDWMPKGDAVLDRPCLPDELAPQLAAAGIGGTVLVQAAATVNETEYMLGLADAVPMVRGVVGWVDFEDPAARRDLERLKGHPKFRGVRPMIQDIPDDDWMLRADVQWAYAALADLDLTFDALGFPRHLANFLTLLGRYPKLRVVLDHCMKPQIGQGRAGFDHWAEGMSRLADETGAMLKLSGLITEAGPDWRIADLQPYVAHVLKVFGPDRIMWGSDWPVCRLSGDYADWRAASETLLADLPAVDRDRIFGGTAVGFYRL